MAAAVGSAQLVHSHTWYANLAGQLAAMLYDIPHVMTMHSLEALRPWKAEQLGGGYTVSSWCERVAAASAAAVVAVSDGMKVNVLGRYPVRPNGCGSSATASTPTNTGPIRRPGY